MNRFGISWMYFFLLFASTAMSQEDTLSNLQHVDVLVNNAILHTAPKTIIPSSVVLKSKGSPESILEFRIENKRLLLMDFEKYLGDSIEVTLRTFNFDIGKDYFRIDSSQMQIKDKVIYIGYDYRPFRNNENAIFASKDLNYNGSISRGFSVGNSQSLVLNSNFNLQLSGEISDDISIIAAISDDNIPIQPEGNTQILQEFDKVFIKVSKDETSVVAGDYNLLNPKGYFQRYNKRLQGLSVENSSKLSKKTRIKNKASAAAAKGKFARQRLVVQEGNQGPYKLQGNNGERFLIIQSGSERVYLDGVLLKRGFENDYTIDYNRAEITFTPTKLLTKDYRIVVEFEYSDQSYLRTVYATNTAIQGEKFRAHFNFYSEQDSKTATGNISLDSTDVAILQSAGDNSNLSVRSGIRGVDTESSNVRDRIRYTLEIIDGDSVLVYSADPTIGLFTAVFSEVIGGEGDYEIANDLGVNGRVYRYVGKGQGSYLPSFTLVAPEQLRMFSLGGGYQLGNKGELSAELSMSQFDKNKFSSIDDGDNTGFAGFMSYGKTFELGKNANWSLASSAKAEMVDKRFNILNPYRDQEFVRDWNVLNQGTKENEQIYKGALSLQSKSKSKIEYEYAGFRRGNSYKGDRHITKFSFDQKGFVIDLIGNALFTSDKDFTSKFYRPKGLISKKLTSFYDWTVALYSELEYNQIQSITDATLSANSFYYDLSKFTLKSPESENYSITLNGVFRRDRRVEDNAFVKVNQAASFEVENRWKINNNQNLNWSIAARKLTVDKPVLSTSDPKTTILGKVDYTFSLWEGTIRSTTAYNLDSGQEPKLEFVYFKLENADLGDYIYLGDDDQGLDESLFQYSPGNPMAFYQRTSQFNNEFVQTNNQSLNQSLRIDFRNLWKLRPGNGAKVKEKRKESSKRKLNGLQKFTRRFSLISNVRLTQKVSDNSGDGGINLVNFDLADTTLIAGTRLMNHTLFFNKGNALYDIQLGNRTAENKLVQISGFELRGNKSYFTRLRWNLKRYIDFINLLEIGRKNGDSEQYSNRDFDIQYYLINPKFNYRPTGSLRLSSEFKYSETKQQIMDLESAITRDITLGVSYRRATAESLDLSLSFIDVKYQGAPNSVVEFEILDGLKNGRNMIWSINYIKRLNNTIDLNLNYEGRKTGISPVFNVARAQIKATF